MLVLLLAVIPVRDASSTGEQCGSKQAAKPGFLNYRRSSATTSRCYLAKDVGHVLSLTGLFESQKQPCLLTLPPKLIMRVSIDSALQPAMELQTFT